MRVQLKEIQLRNFISIGNKVLTIDFREGLFRVTGENLDNNTKNGTGKSSVFCDGLMFGLFGKPLRKINIPDLPNTINNRKNCEIKLTFSLENKNYMIYRGINPTFLKLYENYNVGDEDAKCNDNEKQDSAKKFTQKRIDELIGANYNTYSHLLIMSNSYATPFLDLRNDQKRQIVEDILGISIFGDMSEVAKNESLSLKGNVNVTTKEYEVSSSNFESLKSNHRKLKKMSNEFTLNKKNRLTELKTHLSSLKSDIKLLEAKTNDEKIKEKIVSLKNHLDKNKKKKNKIYVNKQVNERTIKSNERVIIQLEGKPVCPLCNTETNSKHIEDHMFNLINEVNNKKVEVENETKQISEVESKIESINSKIAELNDKLAICIDNFNKLQQLNFDKTRTETEVEKVKSEKNNFLELINEEELNNKQTEIKELEDKLNTYSVEREYYEYIRKLLSDSGIKNYVIKKVVKFWNLKVNYYLNKLNAEFTIKFDESLNALIKSRNRDELQYHSFSGGEKARIDVAILLSIIDISKLQNSIDLNVMVIDELLDSGLDETGREDVLNLFKDMSIKQNKSIYVISHNPNLPVDLFNKEITLYKKNGFTYV